MHEKSTTQDLMQIGVSEKQSSWQISLKRLNEYKELIGVIVFVGGGMLWAFGYFVTKAQFAELKCFSKNSIIVNRETVRLSENDERVVERSRKLEDLIEAEKNLGSLTKAEKDDRVRLERELKKLDETEKRLRGNLAQAQTKLENSDCMGADEK